jgi:xanthine dehydrogenase YagS FAD-binding subunit
LQPVELITAVHVPANQFNKQYYLKICDRLYYAFALVSVAVALKVKGGTIKNASLAMGGVAYKPWRLTAVEQYLIGKAAIVEALSKALA